MKLWSRAAHSTTHIAEVVNCFTIILHSNQNIRLRKWPAIMNIHSKMRKNATITSVTCGNSGLQPRRQPQPLCISLLPLQLALILRPVLGAVFRHEVSKAWTSAEFLSDLIQLGRVSSSLGLKITTQSKRLWNDLSYSWNLWVYMKLH